MQLFVYGSLKKGFRGHYLLKGQKFLKNVSILGYDLYKIWWYPGIVPGNGTVSGELYEIDPSIINDLDRYECVRAVALTSYQPSYDDLFRRETILVDGKETIIYVYNQNIEGEKIESGVWNV